MLMPPSTTITDPVTYRGLVMEKRGHDMGQFRRSAETADRHTFPRSTTVGQRHGLEDGRLESTREDTVDRHSLAGHRPRQ